MLQYLKHMGAFSLSAMTVLGLSGCAPPAAVLPGDRVEMSFTCRLPCGELAATTRADSSVSGETKAPVYLPRTGPETVTVTAGQLSSETQKQDRQPFEQEIIQRLASMIPGLKEGEQAQRFLEAQRYPVSSPKEKFVKLATVRKRQKEMRLTREEYTGRTGKIPEVGEPFILDKLVPGKVSEVTEKEVMIRFSPVQGKDLATPFGPVSVREMADHYELEIAAEKGRLLRTGGMAGRISDLDATSMTIDYGHPFAGEKLNCDVKVVKVEPRISDDVPSPALQPAARPSNISASPGLDPDTARQLEEALRRMSSGKQAGAGEESATTAPMAASGDLATVHYTAMLEDGTVFYTTRKEVAEDQSTKKSAWFSSAKTYAGESMPVGKAALLPGIGEALEGMAVGGSKRLTLPPEKAFGHADPQKLQKLPLVRTIPRTVTLPAEEYVKRFGSFPVAGKEMPLTPYFPGKVVSVREREVEILLMAEDGKTFSEPFGTTAIKVLGPDVITTLKPVIGSIFPGQSGYGVITASDETSFTLDMNHPLAGKTVIIDLEMSGLAKAANLPPGDLPWQEEHDVALANARKEGKPAVLVLHADWCGFCEKLFSETIPDPRISSLRDRFSWIRINSDKSTEFKKLYGQEGYPMIVLFRPDGSVARKLDGFQEAPILRAALQEML